MQRPLWALTGLTFALIAAAIVAGQDRDPQVETGDRVQIHRPIEYAFRVDPMVHRLRARRGQTLPVTFQIIGKDRPTTVIVKTVALRQQENGVIMPREDEPPPEHLKIDNPGQYDIKPGETVEIKGEVHLPANSLSNFHSFGLLIKDIGAQSPSDNSPSNETESRVGIKFITQYLCRTDIQVIGSRGTSLSQLKLESADLVDADGLPMARVWVSNPTDGPLEFQMRCALTNPSVLSRQSHFPLVMPVRSTLKDEARRMVRILPNSRIRLEDLVPYPLFPGDYELKAELLDGSRPISNATFQVAVAPQQFPALAATVAQVTDRVTAVPAQVELSLRDGGDRYLPVTFNNNSTAIVDIELAPASLDGTPFEWLSVRPERLRLQPGYERKALVVMGANRDSDPHRFASVVATAKDANGRELGSYQVPVALVGRSEAGPKLNVTKIQWEPDGEHPGFLVMVENTGKLHLPLNGELELAAEHGQPQRAVGGHGRWLLPGQSGQLHFPLREATAPGLYEMRLQIETGDPENPFVFQQAFQVNDDRQAGSEDSRSTR